MPRNIWQFVMAVTLLSLVSCSGESETVYFDNVEYEPSMVEIEMFTEEIPMLSEHVPVSEASYSQAWQEAYSDLLSKYYNKTAHLPAEERWLFTLHDINVDGVPELIIWESVVSFFFAAHSVYTFFDEEAHKLEIVDNFGGSPVSLSIFPPPDNTSGMIVSGAGELFWRHMLINMEDNRLVIDVCFVVSMLPRDRGYTDALYYIWGLDVVPTELPDFLYWLEAENENMVSSDYVLVSEEEFYRLRDVVFGSMSESERVRLYPLEAKNIITEWR